MIARPATFRLFAILLLVSVAPFCPTAIGQASGENLVAAEVKAEAQPSEFVLQKRVDEVNLLFTVVDHKGKFVSHLTLDDFQLLDNQLPPQAIHAFQQETDLPLRVALLVDVSGSVTSRFKYEQGAAVAFLKKILRPSVDKAMVLGFDEKVHLEQDLTNNVDSLRGAVRRLKPRGETALYDAVVFAADKLRDESERNTRRVIILISDGENNSSRAIMNDAQQAALRAECPIYSLSTNDLRGGDYPKGEAILELLSRYTGGELLPAHEQSQVSSAFRQVEQALRSQYVLSYKPADFEADGRYRSVALSARKHNFKVECRHGYYATKN